MEFWEELGWHTTTSYKFTIFNTEFETYIYIRVYGDEPSVDFSEEQEAAIKKLLNSWDELRSIAENGLLSLFSGVEPTDIMENIDTEQFGVTITKQGDILIKYELVPEFNDMLLDNMADDILLDDMFGMAVYPTYTLLPNFDEMMDFKARE